jgi:energy-coupling factor transporter ATP-binding protein EcfA2
MNLLLKSFEIKNLFNRCDVFLPFDQNINIFLGENGMGKTTVLNCLYYVLDGKIEKLKDIVFDEISITFFDNEKFSLKHNDIMAYAENLYSHSYSRRHYINIDSIFSPNEIDKLLSLYKLNPDDDELLKSYYRISEIFGMPTRFAKKEFENYILKKNNNAKVNIKNISHFKQQISKKLDCGIIYFPTYRRIEEDMSNLGIDTEKDTFKVSERLIQFGMTDVDKNISKLLDTIKSVAITGFTKMTGILIKQYLKGDLPPVEKYIVDQEKLTIALARIGDEIEDKDKQKIIEQVNNNEITNTNNIYLFNLIKNLIVSYENQTLYDERIIKFVKVCNKYLNGKQFIYDKSNVEIGIYINDSKEKIRIQDLSSGEKQVISIFSKLYIEETNPSIILFDEPELSLSIHWQQMFLPDVMASEKCSALIAVTHSPFIFENIFDEFAQGMGDCLTSSMGK